jgi:hypothetical protein
LLNLDITEIAAYDITFELSWLKKHDPDISYRKAIIKFRNYKCILKVEIQEISLKAITVFYRRDPNSVIFVIVLMENELNEFKSLFKEYARFKPLFQKKLGKEILPKYQLWDHEIPLIEGK